MRNINCPVGVAALVACATITTALFGDNPTNPGRDNSHADQTKSGHTWQGDQMGVRNEMDMYKDWASDTRSIPDKLFVLDAWRGGQWEIAFSELVIERVDDNRVKELAQMIRDDHQKASEKLRPIAEKMNVPVTDGLPHMKQAKLELLGKLSSDQLAKCYLANQRAVHAKDITCFNDQIAMSTNEQVKAFAKETLPTLREHGNHITEVANAHGITGDFITAGGGSMNEPVEGR